MAYLVLPESANGSRQRVIRLTLTAGCLVMVRLQSGYDLTANHFRGERELPHEFPTVTSATAANASSAGTATGGDRGR